MRVLFSTTPLDGHFRPLLPLARALRAARPRDRVRHGGLLASACRGRGLRGARRRGGPRRRQGRSDLDAVLGRRSRRCRRSTGGRTSSRTSSPQGHAPLKLPELLDVARAWQRAGGRVRERRPRGAGRRRLARASVRQPLVRDDGLALDPRARRAGTSRRSGARRALEPDPVRGRVRGLYVDVVPPLLAGERPLCAEHPAAARGGGAGRAPPPWLERAAAAARLRDHGHGLQPARVLRAAARRARRRRRRRAASPSAATSIRPSSATCPPNVRVERFVPQDAGAASLRRRRLARRLGHACSARSRTALPLVLRPAGRRPVRQRGPLRARGRRGRACAPERASRRTRSRPRCGACSTEPAYAEAARAIAGRDSRQMRTAEEVAAAVEEHVGASLVWPRVCTRPHRAGRGRAGRGRRRGRRRRGGAHRRRGRRRVDRRGGAEAARGRAAARALARGPRRRRGARSPPRRGALRRREAAAGGGDLRALRLARGEARRRLRGLAGERGPDRAARRPLSAQLARAAPRRAVALLGRHRRRADRLARGARRRAGHAVRGPRGRPHPRAGLRARPARLRRQLRLPDRGQDAGRAAASGSPPTGRCAGGCSTGSRCSGSAAPSPRAAPSRRRASWRRTTSTRSSPMRSVATTREIRRRRSPASARSAAASRTRRRCASTSACCCSGRRTSRRRSASSSWPRKAEPGSRIAAEAKRYLDAVRNAGTS